MLTIAGGIILAIVILGILGAAWGTLSRIDDHHPPESDRAIARRKALTEKLARGPCYLDKRRGVRTGLRKWDWPG